MFDFSKENLLHSNLFNFTIMVATFAFIAFKVRVGDKVESHRKKLAATVDNSISAKDKAHNDLKQVEESVKNTAVEIEEIVSAAKATLATIEEKIFTDASKQVKTIEENVVKVVEAEASRLNSRLAKGVSNASVALAESNMVRLLTNNPELHNKFIYESVDELDKVDFGV